jgi:ComF family protein
MEQEMAQARQAGQRQQTDSPAGGLGRTARSLVRRQAALAGQIARTVTDIIWPPHSLLSHAFTGVHGTVEPPLWQALNLLMSTVCGRCGVPLPEAIGPDVECAACIARPPQVARARAAMAYDDLSRPLVLALKHAGRRDGLAMFASLMCEAAPFTAQADALVPVPSHPWRLARRGFNQACWLAAAVSKASGTPWLPDTLRRIRATPSQNHLDHTGRRANVAGAFAVLETGRRGVTGRHLVLVDDVHTTGATLEACAAALLAAGAAQVDAVTLARVCQPGRIEHAAFATV